jgi:hypothetical protein
MEKCLICKKEIPTNHARLVHKNGLIHLSCENAAKERIRVFNLSPQLGDGSTITVESSVDIVLERMKEFCEYAIAGEYEPGEFCKVEIAELSRLEFETLPEL